MKQIDIIVYYKVDACGRLEYGPIVYKPANLEACITKQNTLNELGFTCFIETIQIEEENKHE